MLKVNLFGPLRITKNGQPLKLPASVPAQSLLGFLFLHQKPTLSRSVIAETLWPGLDETRSRRKLSQALWNLKTALPGLVTADRQVIKVDQTAAWVDTLEFQKFVKTDQSLKQAVALYAEELLSGFYEDWVFAWREQFRNQYLSALARLIQLEKNHANFEGAVNYGCQLLEEDPFHEETHRELMRLYGELDRPAAALKQYENLGQILRKEFDTTPNPETIRLAEKISQTISLNHPAATELVNSPLKKDRFPKTLPLIGQEEIRRKILGHIDQMLDGFGGLILLEGEAGVGKTRLLEEIARDADWRGIQVLWGYGREIEVTSAFGPFVSAMESSLSSLRIEQLSQAVEQPWLQVLSTLLPSIESNLSDSPQIVALDPSQEQARLLEAFGQLLTEWSNITPLVIILENLHWIDFDTLDFLPGLIQRIKQAGVLVIGTYRGEEARTYPILWEKIQTIDRACCKDRLIMNRLTAAETGDLIRRYLDFKGEAPVFESRIYQETEGNPLFILETLRTLQEEGYLQVDSSGEWSTPWDETTTDYTEIPLPPALERVIARRLKHLLPSEQAILETAAILGNQFEFSLLKTVIDEEPAVLFQSLGNLIRRQFLYETTRDYGFTHEKIRQVTYQSIDPDRRKRKHHRVGQVLENQSPDQVNSLAFHFFHGEIWEKASHYNLIAGDHARLRYATSEAIKCYDRAIQSWEFQNRSEPQIGINMYQKRGRTHQETGNFDQAESDYQTAILYAEQVDEKGSFVQILNHLSYLQFQRGNFDGAASIARDALDLAINTDFSTEIAASLLNQANALRNLGYYKTSIDLYEQAATIFEKHNDQIRLADCLNRMGAALNHTGDYVKSQSSIESSLNIRRRLDDRMGISYCLINLAGLWYNQGQFTLSKQAAQEALDIATSINDPYGQDAANHFLGLASLVKGETGQAISYFEEALRISREIGDQALETEVLVDLGKAYQELNQLEKAQGMYEQSLHNTANSIEQYRLSYVYHHLALLFLEMKQFDKAIANGQTGLRIAKEVGEPWALGRAYRIMGEISGHLGSDLTGFEPILCFEESTQILTTIGAEAELAQSMAAYGLFLRKSGQTRESSELIEGAKNTFNKLGMQSANDCLNEAMNAHLLPGQRKVSLPHMAAPTGRPLKDDEWVEVTWTVTAPEDETISGHAARRRHQLLRLLQEAAVQEAAPTIGDLAAHLNVGTATIKRDLAALREAGIPVHTRGSRN